MKVQCPQCREIVELAEFSTSEEGLRFTCGNCNQANFLANPKQAAAKPRPAPAGVPAPADEVTCPKCGHGQKDNYACHRCGLVFEKFDESSLPPDPQAAAALWKEVQLLPADESRHEAFLDACQKADRLDYASRMYRRLSRQPGQHEIAEKMQERILSRAQAQLAPATVAAEGQRNETKKRSKILLWIVVAVFVAIFAYYFFTMTEMLTQMGP